MFRLWLKTRRWKQERMRLREIHNEMRDQLCIDACAWHQVNANSDFDECTRSIALQQLVLSILKYKESQANLINQPLP